MKRCTKCDEEKPAEEFSETTVKGKIYARSFCKECMKLCSKEWRLRNPGAAAKIQKKWRRENKELAKRLSREYRRKNRFKMALKDSFTSAMKKGYRPCSATEEEIREAFTGFCQNPGCRIPEIECKRKLEMDHNHETSKFRGWLCSNCNRSLGMLRESKEAILGLVKYIERTQCAQV